MKEKNNHDLFGKEKEPYGSLSNMFHENTKIFQFDSEKIIREYKRVFPFYESIVEDIHFKCYPRFRQVELPKGITKDIASTFYHVNEFQPKALSKTVISEILSKCAGAYKGKDKDWDSSIRPYPSFGSRYPLELYPVILLSTDIERGLYHYNVKINTLETIKSGDFSTQISDYVGEKGLLKNASMLVLISAIFMRSRMISGDRGYRYVLFEAGHLGQNFLRVLSHIDLACNFIGEFLDDEFNKLLDLDGIQESVIYAIAIGQKKKGLLEKILG